MHTVVTKTLGMKPLTAKSVSGYITSVHYHSVLYTCITDEGYCKLTKTYASSKTRASENPILNSHVRIQSHRHLTHKHFTPCVGTCCVHKVMENMLVRMQKVQKVCNSKYTAFSISVLSHVSIKLDSRY